MVQICINKENFIIKFADDTNLIIPAEFVHTCNEEIQNVKLWAIKNNLTLNETKTKEIVFRNPRTRFNLNMMPLQTPMLNNRKSVFKILGVTFTDTFSMNDRINNILSSCSQALYAMKILKSKGLNNEVLQVIFKSTILSRLLYASQAWYGFLNYSERQRLEAFLRKSKKLLYAPDDLQMFSELCENNDDTLFCNVSCNSNHVLASLLPVKKELT